MKKLEPIEKILLSWKKCAERRDLDNIFNPICMDENLTQDLLSSYKSLISVYSKSIKKVKRNLTNVFFLLTDSNGILLSKTGMAEEQWLKVGVSFAEKDSGTNAISMSLYLDKPVLMLPEYHYCRFLKKWNCYAVPIHMYKKKVV